MKRFLPYTIAAALIFAGCSNHIEDLKVPSAPEPTIDVDVEVEVEFKTLLLGYDSETSTATATGLGDEGVVYSWSMDGKEDSDVFKSKKGASCVLDAEKLLVGKNYTLLVVGTVNGVSYSSDCKITIEPEADSSESE